MASDQTQLQQVVIENSEANTWNNAKKEWDLVTIFSENSHCICNHFIVDNCEIKNRNNGKTLIVGNVCINHFGEEHLKVDKNCFDQLKKITKSPTKPAGVELLNFARKHKIWEDNVNDIYRNTVWTKGTNPTNRNKRRALTIKQSAVVQRLNRLLVLGCSKERPQCPVHHCKMRPKQNWTTKELFWGCPKYGTEQCKHTRPAV